MWNVLPQDPSVDPQLQHAISLGHRALPCSWRDPGTCSGDRTDPSFLSLCHSSQTPQCDAQCHPPVSPAVALGSCCAPTPPAALPHLTYSFASAWANVSSNGMSSGGSTRSRRMDRRRAGSSSTFLGLALEQREHLSHRAESPCLGTGPRAQLTDTSPSWPCRRMGSFSTRATEEQNQERSAVHTRLPPLFPCDASLRSSPHPLSPQPFPPPPIAQLTLYLGFSSTWHGFGTASVFSSTLTGHPLPCTLVTPSFFSLHLFPTFVFLPQ